MKISAEEKAAKDRMNKEYWKKRSLYACKRKRRIDNWEQRLSVPRSDDDFESVTF
jgi:hypothetical protein